MAANESLDQQIEKKLEGYPPEKREKLRGFAKSLVEGQSPQEAIGLSPEYVEGMYSFAYRLYTTGKYEQAAQLFRMLVLLNPMESRFLLGLAAAYHMKKDYENASQTYMLCSAVNPQDPVPYFHASDCFMALQEWKTAYNALIICIDKCGKKPEYKDVKNRAEASKEMIEEQAKKVLGEE